MDAASIVAVAHCWLKKVRSATPRLLRAAFTWKVWELECEGVSGHQPDTRPLSNPECWEHIEVADEHPTKHCRRCDTAKPLDEFGVNRNTRDGLTAYCRSCLNTYHKARRLVYPSTRSPSRGLKLLAKKAIAAERLAAEAKAAKRSVAAEHKALATEVVVPALAAMKAAVSALETLLGTLKAASSALEMLVGSATPKTKPRTANGVRPAHPKPASEAPPSIRTIKDIVAHERVTLNEAKRIQEQEILARAEWRVSIIH